MHFGIRLKFFHLLFVHPKLNLPLLYHVNVRLTLPSQFFHFAQDLLPIFVFSADEGAFSGVLLHSNPVTEPELLHCPTF